MNVNKAFILGRVTADPQLRSTPNGTSTASFNIATNKVWTDKSGQKHEDVQFHQIVTWGRLAEIASQYLVKGSTVFVEGELQTREWTDKAGAKHRATEIIASSLQLGPRPDGAGRPAKAEPQPEEPVGQIDLPEDVNPNDLPF